MGILSLMEDEDGFRIIIETQTNVSILLEKFGKMEAHMSDMAKHMSSLKCDVHDEKLKNIEEKFVLQGKLPCDANEQRFKTVEGHIKWMGGFVATVITASIIYIGKFMGAGPK